MDWLASLLTTAVSTAIWAFMLYKLGLHISRRFAGTIDGAVSRLERLGPAKFSPASLPQDTDAARQIDASEPSRELAAPPSPMLARLEEPLRNWLNTIPPEQRESSLLRALAASQVAWNFEVVNYFILGSQIALLQLLNSQPVLVDQARAHYDRAAQFFPAFYTGYSYDGWLTWMQNTSRLVAIHDSTVTITEEGREFLRYLILRGYPLSRPG